MLLVFERKKNIDFNDMPDNVQLSTNERNKTKRTDFPGLDSPRNLRLKKKSTEGKDSMQAHTFLPWAGWAQKGI